MNQDIKYLGYTAQPSGYLSADGDLSLSLNLVNENGSLAPLLPPAVKFQIGAGNKLFLHRTAAIANYIAYNPDGSSLLWLGSETAGLFPEPRPVALPEGIGAITDIAAVGYILIISTATGTYYIRYNASAENYTFLGSRIPDIKLDLALKLNFTTSDVREKSFEISTPDADHEITSPDDRWQTVIATSYDVSTAAGTLSREWVRNPDFCDTHVSTQRIPFGEEFILHPDVEYKFNWQVIAGAHIGMTLSLWGYRNGAPERELILSRANENALANSQEIKKTFSYEWTGIVYTIEFPYKNTDSPKCATRGNITCYKGIDSSQSGSSDVSTYIEYTADSHNAIMGAVNRYVREQATEKSRFIYPFFLRYAVTLYDSSYAFISQPVLLVPNSGCVPAVSFSKHSSLGTRLLLCAFTADIRYRMRNAIPADWNDLITGIDIFVSPHIWPYDQGQEFDAKKNYFRFSSSPTSSSFGQPFFDNIPSDGDSYERRELPDYIRRYATSALVNNYVTIAQRNAEDISKDLASVSNFYKLTSLSTDDLAKAVGTFADLDLKNINLSSLVSRQPLADDVTPYAGFRGAILKEYNRRLHFCHSSVILPEASHPKDIFNYLSDNGGQSIVTYIFLKSDDGAKLLRRAEAGSINGPWFFYPDTRAYKAAFILHDADGSPVALSEIDLKPHDFLNGAYWLADSLVGSLPFRETDTDPYASLTVDDTVPALSTVYVSEVNNPFVFKAASAVSVGASEVFALSTAARPLSQGQFGQFPLYAFTSEGVWALSVSTTGTYLAVQPIVRDTTININSITQIDAAVLFTSARGVMMLTGSEAQPISDVIDTDVPSPLSSLPGFSQLFTGARPLEIRPFPAFLADARMLYDYPHQRIILYNPDLPYAYVFSLKSRLWSMMQAQISSTVNSYPQPLALNKNGEVLDFSQSSQSSVHSVLLTRPLKLQGADILKTVDTVIQRGLFADGHVSTVLYGSRDLIHWFLVWSSRDHYLTAFRGSPYKFFRIAAGASLTSGETITGASISFTPRHVTKLH